jgi:hypothetical protein
MAALVKTYFQAFTTDAQGQIQITGILDIKDYQRAHLEIIQHPGSVPNLTVEVHMGKISGSTLSQVVASFPLGAATIHTLNVVGPEITVWVLGGPPNTAVQIQAWLFLH